MSNYTKTTDFGAKDSLPTGDSGKIIRGTEFETEFDAISTAIATKADTAGPTFTGTLTFETISDGTISVTAFVDEDDMSSNSANLVPTQQSVKAYVDSQVTAQDLDFQADSGGALSIDLDSETMTFTGGTGIDTSGSGNAVTFAIDSTVATLTGSQTLTNKTLTSPVLNTGVSGTAVLDEDNMASNSATQLATQQSIKAYVDSQVGANNELSEILANGNTTGGTNIVFGDSASVSDDRLVFGAGSDLQIYHSGTHSYIDDAGTGNLTLRGNASVRVEKYEGEVLADFAADGAVSLYHDNSVKIATTSSGVSVTGNVAVSGTVDGRDVATDGTKLDTVETNADVTDTANVTAAGALMDSELTSEASVKALNQGVATTDSPTFAAVTVNGNVEFDGLSGTGSVTVTDILDQDDMSGNSATALATQQSIKAYVDSQVATADTLAEVLANGNTTGGTDVAFGDNDKAIFGAGSDLALYHDGSNSYIKDQGTGDLYIQGEANVRITDGDGNKMFLGQNDGEVQLYYNGAEKLNTTNTGIDVTGVITTDGMTTSADINFGDNDKAVFGAGSDLQIYHDGSDSYIKDEGTGNLYLTTNGSTMNLQAGSDNMVKIYKDAQVEIFHDASVKLATTSSGIDVTGTAVTDGLTVAGNVSVDSGNVLVGTTSTSTATQGIKLRSDIDAIAAVADGQVSGYFGRLNSDGNILNLRKDSTTVGNIGIESSGFYLDGEASHAGLKMFGGAIGSRQNGSDVDATIDLGWSGGRFKDLYLSGTANTAGLSVDGGTIKLDGDYPTGSENVALGNSALASVGSGASYNVAIGSESLNQLTNGDNNTAVGFDSLRNTTTAANNSALGFQALRANTTGASNVGISYRALYQNSTGAGNIGIGLNALYANTTADHNIAIGTAALDANTTGAYNVGIGNNALGANTTSSNNTAVGTSALSANTTGGTNTAVGNYSLQSNTTASHNTAIGYTALEDNTTGDLNTALGYAALSNNVGGDRAVAVGVSALESQNVSSGDTYNVAMGYAAGYAITTGTHNTLLGGLAGDALTTSTRNTALGYGTLSADTLGSHSTAVGNLALVNQNFTTATDVYNTAVGSSAGQEITTGVQNTLIGGLAGDALTTGGNNVAVGKSALTTETGASSSIAIGKEALRDQNVGSGNAYNVSVGFEAGKLVTTGIRNTLLGGLAGDALTDADYNIAIGYESLTSDTLGSRSTAVGYATLASQNFTSATDSYNTAYGFNAGNKVTTGIFNTLIGGLTGDAITTASYNTAVGGSALSATTTGAENVAVGHGALEANTTASNNTAVGKNALAANTTGVNNTSLGHTALSSNTTGDTNTAVGQNSLLSNTTGTNNTAVGARSLDANTTGTNNVAVGDQALGGNTEGNRNTVVGTAAGLAITTGDDNTLLGQGAGEALTTPDFNTLIGKDAGKSITTGAKNTIIGGYNGNEGGLDIRTSSNYIVLSDGDGNPRAFFNPTGEMFVGGTNDANIATADPNIITNESFGIADGTNKTAFQLDRINFDTGNYYILNASATGVRLTNGSTSWTTQSDETIKENITELTGVLPKVLNLRCVSYNLKSQNDDDVKLGFIAQDWQTDFAEVVHVDAADSKLGMNYTETIPVLLKAIQELKSELDAATARIATLESN